jgi:hypothetical protein
VCVVQAKNPANGNVYIVAEALLAAFPGAVPKAKKGKKEGEKEAEGFQVCFNGMV